jgi:hypothetical protein
LEAAPELPELPELPGLTAPADISSLSTDEKRIWDGVAKRHRREYLAELFSAAYVGKATKGFLEQFCPYAKVAHTHASSNAWFALLDDFYKRRSTQSSKCSRRRLLRGDCLSLKKCSTRQT